MQQVGDQGNEKPSDGRVGRVGRVDYRGKATDVAACKLARCTRDKGETPE